MNKKYYLLFTGLFLINILAVAQQGRSLNFDGVDDEVSCGNDASLQITGTAITLEARVNIDVFSTYIWEGSIIDKLSSPYEGYGIRIGATGQVSFVIGNSTDWPELISPENTITMGAWYHVACTYDGTTMRMYIDGTEVATQSTTTSIVNSSSPLRLGGSYWFPRYIDGTLDEVRIWNVVRNPTEIAANDNTELTLPQTGLVAYYQFNQGIANADNTGEMTLNDALGTNNGTLSNFTLNGTSSNWLGDGVLSIENSTLKNVSVIHNSIQNTISVKGLSESTHYTIYNELGQKLLQGSIFENNINVEVLQQGMYIINLNRLGSLKFVKQ